ncbi:long-chain-fatty-acid--CoA ligase [Williamsia sp. CHRR-6]|uniref:long-chain-fatty-acid--CoA ligase n=1 Tax=Williamsia sp. CHRR-6 TaxID=2835871 RepID=UPI001BDB569B|nr:long-chain-fatty-acid--CoA ligase [Williamsia sp. CHRR-6]MBT0565361.1 long-chain-fatty-acid--CoA ligase [Williamsia sp. CHRR-6]
MVAPHVDRTDISPIGEPMRSRRHTWTTSIRRHARMTPDAPALSFLGEVTTWAQLERRTDALASALARRGIGFGDRVVVLMLNRPEYLEIVVAVNRIGAIAVPVNFRMTPAEVSFIVDDCAAKMLVADAPLVQLATAVAQRCGSVRHLVVTGVPDVLGEHESFEALTDEVGDPAPVVDVPEESVMLLMYTSGTTGRPKGAMLSYSNIMSQTMTALHASPIGAQDRPSCVVPMFHIAGIVSFAPSIHVGAVMLIQPLGAFDPDVFLDTAQADRTTSVFLVPAQWQLVCAAQLARPRTLALRTLSWGAAPASDAVLRAMAQAFPDAENLAMFGQTEMSPVTCCLRGVDSLRKIGSVGRVVESVEARVVDSEMNDVAPGEVGEIVYRGTGLMLGYWNNPQGTAAAFDGGWFHSGDLVRVDDEGFVYVVDRKKDMIISGGENIYCAELENVLADHPLIVEAAVIGRSDPTWGEVPIAVVVTSGEQVSVADLTVFLDQRLARFKHPKDVVVLSELPRTATGKVRKPDLRAAYGGSDSALTEHRI